MRRLVGVAGLGYVAGVSIENMEVLESPTLASPVADVRALYEDEALATVTTVAGAVALIFYLVFAVALVRLVQGRGRRRDPWSVVALVGGIGGPLLAAAGLVASAVLILDGGLSDDEVGDLFDFYLRVRIVSGLFVAMFLGGVGLAALRSRVLPAWLGWYACALAIPMVVVPFAALGEDRSLAIAVGIAFALQTLWIFLTSLWLTLADDVRPVTFVRRSAFLLLVLAAGLIGIALVAVPGATGEFFSWDLGPEPLAAFAGGVYVGSAVAYAAALPRGEREVRGLVLGAVVLSVSVFVITLVHLDQFDFDRLQAWAWVVLFGGFSVATAGIFVVGPTESPNQPAEPLVPAARLLLAVVGIVLGALAVALWRDPVRLAGASPFELPPLGGRFAGSWVALVAVLAGWAAVRNRADEARLSALALLALSAGALVAALRTLPDLDPATGYIVVLVLLVATGGVALGLTPSRRGLER
ncbi:MAG: hypothetical protein ICV69_09760 [Thermoleophilaceae bacterium]|nr:hypothetical protein [Thermoleophilaceae bacterium]